MQENTEKSSESKEPKPIDVVPKDAKTGTESEKKDTIIEAVKKVIKKVTKKKPKDKKPKDKKPVPKQESERDKVFKDLNTDFLQLQEKVIGLSRKSTGGMALRLNRVSKLLSQSMKMLK